MSITPEQFARIKSSLPVERGNVSIRQLNFLNAILYVLENGCKWRRLPREYGNWHTLYTRMNRWSKAGVLARVLARLQQEQIIAVRMTVLSLDSTTVKVHPDGAGALKKTGRKPSARVAAAGPPNCIWLPQLTGAR
jgi:transposase